jgi:hypothetical protein
MSLVDDRMKIKVQCSATAHDIRAMPWETQRKWTLEQSYGKFREHEILMFVFKIRQRRKTCERRSGISRRPWYIKPA